MTYRHGTADSATPAQSTSVTRFSGERLPAGKRTNASGIRNRRWMARISRGSHAPAYAVQMWNRAATAAQPPTAQPTTPESLRMPLLQQAGFLVRLLRAGVQRHVGQAHGVLGIEVLERGMDLPDAVDVGEQHLRELVNDVGRHFLVRHDGVGHGDGRDVLVVVHDVLVRAPGDYAP